MRSDYISSSAPLVMRPITDGPGKLTIRITSADMVPCASGGQVSDLHNKQARCNDKRVSQKTVHFEPNFIDYSALSFSGNEANSLTKQIEPSPNPTPIENLVSTLVSLACRSSEISEQLTNRML